MSPLADLDRLVVEGRYGRADVALRRIEALIPSLAQSADVETLLLALYGRALLLRQLGAGTQNAISACDVLERAAHERQATLWAATACALRARFRVDAGDIGGATADLARADAELDTEDLSSSTGYRLLEGIALVYAGLRLNDRADEIRARIESAIGSRRVLERAQHWAGWSGELASRAMEPLAGGAPEPQHELMARAVQIAAKLDDLPEAEVPPTLRRGARGVRALSAAYRGRPSEALRLLGPDAFGTVGDLPTVERQIVSLAAMRAHALVGSLATARSLDDAAAAPPATLANLVLEVCRTRERLWLETYAGGDVVPVLHRMTELLVRLGWRGMDLVADTARQALEHQALRTESRTDALTGVGNRRALDEELRQLLRFGTLPLALILVDIDHFKEVNDRFTHVVGDEVLRRVAASLSLQLRTDDQLLRYGGDEFVVLLPGTGDEEANAVAERMVAAVAARPWNELADGLLATVTTGVAAVWSLSGRRPDADAEKLFRRADERLLHAKRDRPGDAGRSRGGPSLIAPLPSKETRAAAEHIAASEHRTPTRPSTRTSPPASPGPSPRPVTMTGPMPVIEPISLARPLPPAASARPVPAHPTPAAGLRQPAARPTPAPAAPDSSEPVTASIPVIRPAPAPAPGTATRAASASPSPTAGPSAATIPPAPARSTAAPSHPAPPSAPPPSAPPPSAAPPSPAPPSPAPPSPARTAAAQGLPRHEVTRRAPAGEPEMIDLGSGPVTHSRAAPPAPAPESGARTPGTARRPSPFDPLPTGIIDLSAPVTRAALGQSDVVGADTTSRHASGSDAADVPPLPQRPDAAKPDPFGPPAAFPPSSLTTPPAAPAPEPVAPAPAAFSPPPVFPASPAFPAPVFPAGSAFSAPPIFPATPATARPPAVPEVPAEREFDGPSEPPALPVRKVPDHASRTHSGPSHSGPTHSGPSHAGAPAAPPRSRRQALDASGAMKLPTALPASDSVPHASLASPPPSRSANSPGSYADLKLPSHYRPGGYEPPSYDTGDQPPVKDLPPGRDYQPAENHPLTGDPLSSPLSPHLGLPAPWGAGGPWEPGPDSPYESFEPADDPLAPSSSPYGPPPAEQPEPAAPPPPPAPADDRPRRPQRANPWREPTGPLTARQAIIDLSARKRPRPRN